MMSDERMLVESFASCYRSMPNGPLQTKRELLGKLIANWVERTSEENALQFVECLCEIDSGRLNHGLPKL